MGAKNIFTIDFHNDITLKNSAFTRNLKTVKKNVRYVHKVFKI